MNYYNEFDPGAAAWLRELIREGLIPDGFVDERSIEDVRPDELVGYTQCHFFAGIGGWPLALQMAGVSPDTPLWTGSCPCQPFSAAGKGKGTDDERHLWPAFRWLIQQCRPATVFGEQVASKAGREWFAGVRADLEALAYACGGADLCAAGVGAPHIRQRLFWVANACDAQRERGRISGRVHQEYHSAWGYGSPCYERISDTDVSGQSGQGRMVRSSNTAAGEDRQEHRAVNAGGSNWGAAEYVPCADGKARRIEPSIEPLAHGIPARVVRLRGYGNAIVPQVAAEFIGASINA